MSLCDSFTASGIPSRQRATHCIYIRQRFYPLLRPLWASHKWQAWWMNTVWRRYPRCLLISSCWQYPFWPSSQWLLYWDLANCVWGVVKAPQTGFQFNFCATPSNATWFCWSKTETSRAMRWACVQTKKTPNYKDVERLRMLSLKNRHIQKFSFSVLFIFCVFAICTHDHLW